MFIPLKKRKKKQEIEEEIRDRKRDKDRRRNKRYEKKYICNFGGGCDDDYRCRRMQTG